MRTRTLLLVLALAALAIPLAAGASSAAPDHQTSAAKKKRSYCEKKIKKQKGSHTKKVKSAKFFLAVTKRPTEYFFCSESPKFSGSISAWDGIKKTKYLRAVKKNCAIFYTEAKSNSASDSGEKKLNIVAAKYFKKGAVKQTFSSRLGEKDDSVSLASLSLSKNCVFAAGYVLNGKPMIEIAGIGNFPYQGFYEKALPNASVSELKKIKITVTSKTSVQVSWTQGGVPTTLDYPGNLD